MAGNCVQEATAAAWLMERMEALRVAGQVKLGPRRRDEVDVLASMTFWPVGAGEE